MPIVSSTSPHTSGLFVVRHRVRRRSPSWPPSPVLQPCLPAARLRASSRLRARAHRSSASGASSRRDLDGHGLRTQPDRALRQARQGARPAHLGAAGGSQARDALRPARRTARRPALQRRCIARVQDVRRCRRLQSAAVRHRRVERARPAASDARRDRTNVASTQRTVAAMDRTPTTRSLAA